MLRILLTTISLVGASIANASAILTDLESRELLRAIDTVCGDTWCAGDRDFSFDELQCGLDECYLVLSSVPRRAGAWKTDRRSMRCELTGFISRDDLLEIWSPSWLTYTPKLYDAVSDCIADFEQSSPLAYVPQASQCRQALELKPHFFSSAHSVWAEEYFEHENPALASAALVATLVGDLSRIHAGCELVYDPIYLDQIKCLDGAKTCELPSDQGSFVVIKDQVDGAAVIFQKASRYQARFGSFLAVGSMELSLPDPAYCYEDLLQFSGPASSPFASLDHRNHFVVLRDLDHDLDSRFNAGRFVQSLVHQLNRRQPASCQYREQKLQVAATSCQVLGRSEVCILSSPTQGYFVVTKAPGVGAQVSFVRYD